MDQLETTDMSKARADGDHTRQPAVTVAAALLAWRIERELMVTAVLFAVICFDPWRNFF